MLSKINIRCRNHHASFLRFDNRLAQTFVHTEQNLVIILNCYFRETFIDPATNHPYVRGQVYKQLKLAKTLALVAKHGPNALYNGVLTEGFVQDIEDHGGIITAEDLKNYK